MSVVMNLNLSSQLRTKYIWGSEILYKLKRTTESPYESKKTGDLHFSVYWEKCRPQRREFVAAEFSGRAEGPQLPPSIAMLALLYPQMITLSLVCKF